MLSFRSLKWVWLIIAVCWLLISLMWSMREEPPIELEDQQVEHRALPSSVAPVEPIPEHNERIVECEFLEDLPEDLRMEEYDPESLQPLGRLEVQRLKGSWVRFLPRHGEGIGKVYGKNVEPSSIGWIDGACLRPVEMKPVPSVTISGVVENSDDERIRGDVAVSVLCGKWPTERFGRFLTLDDHKTDFSLRVPKGLKCDIVASWTHLSQTLRTETLAFETHTDQAFTLVLPLIAPGPGWTLIPAEEGLKIMGVFDDSPAFKAGLRANDLVFSVDGVPVEVGEILNLQAIQSTVEVVTDHGTVTLRLPEPEE